MAGKTDWLKWSLIATTILLGGAILCALVYVLAPSLIAALTGQPSNPCNPPQGNAVGQGPEQITPALARLCNSSQVFLGSLTMILIVVGALPALAMNVLASIEVWKSNMSDLRKVVWLVLFWLALSFIAVWAYYLTDRKKFASRIS